jgi:hypothetical protein
MPPPEKTMTFPQEVLENVFNALLSGRPPKFTFEREIRLHQLKTWVYSSGSPSRVTDAGLFCAVRYMRGIEKALGRQGVRASRLARLLREDDDYKVLYNKFVGRSSWTSLLRKPSAKSFDQSIANRKDGARIVADLVDYGFRYAEHDGQDLACANLSHAIFLRSKYRPPAESEGAPGKPLSERSISERWVMHKPAAIFVYVDREFDFAFFPRKISSESFLDELSQDVEAVDNLRHFLGTCAYVAEKLAPAGWKCLSIPKTIDRLPPVTRPLTTEEEETLKEYAAEKQSPRTHR